MATSILSAFIEETEELKSESFGSGLINSTWRVTGNHSDYILQKINQEVFRDPSKIAANVRIIADYLRKNHPDYLFVEPIQTRSKEDLAYIKGDGYYRLTPFVKGSHTIDVVSTASEAYEASRQFGRFTALLDGLDLSLLNVTIPDFHNLSLRFEQFRESLSKGNQLRISAAEPQVTFIMDHADIVREFDIIRKNPDFKLRVMHHDTKISNVLLDEQNKGLCVIDLDTVMPGYFISDVGDMIRTYLSPASEEENDLGRIRLREDIFEAIVKGYLSEMYDVLSDAEKSAFVYAGKFMIYMQAIRFLSDHFNNDVYYGARYPGHNFNRALNQIELLKQILDREENLVAILNKTIHKVI